MCANKAHLIFEDETLKLENEELKGAIKMIYSKELEEMCEVRKGVDHGPAPIPEEGKIYETIV